MNPIISATDLVKHYPGVVAVAGISLAIRRGSALACSAQRCRQNHPSRCWRGTAAHWRTVLYKGEALGARYREEVGIQFQHTALQEFLTVRETLELFERLYHHTIPIPS